MSLVLVAEGNPDARFEVNGTLVIGRSRLSDIVLDNSEVSRVHCRIIQSDNTALIEDMDSSHGTRVNGERVRGNLAIGPGDKVQVGPYVFVVYDGMAGPVSPKTIDGSRTHGWGFMLRFEAVTAEEEARNPPHELWKDSLRVGHTRAVFLLGAIPGDPITGLKSRMRAQLRRLADQHRGAPEELLGGINATVHQAGKRAQVTCAMLDMPREQLNYAVAVFQPPIIVRESGRAVVGEVAPALEIGQVAAARYQGRRVQVKPYESVVLTNVTLAHHVGRGDATYGFDLLVKICGQQPSDVASVAQRLREVLGRLPPFAGVSALCFGFEQGSGAENR